MEMEAFKPNIHGAPKHNPRYASFEHLIPKENGGIRGPSNIVLAHQWCNNKRLRKKWPHDPVYGQGGGPIIKMDWTARLNGDD